MKNIQRIFRTQYLIHGQEVGRMIKPKAYHEIQRHLTLEVTRSITIMYRNGIWNELNAKL